MPPPYAKVTNECPFFLTSHFPPNVSLFEFMTGDKDPVPLFKNGLRRWVRTLKHVYASRSTITQEIIPGVPCEPLWVNVKRIMSRYIKV